MRTTLFQVVIRTYFEIHGPISFLEPVHDLTPDFPEIARRQTLAVLPRIGEGYSKASHPNNRTLIVERRIQTVQSQRLHREYLTNSFLDNLGQE
jgi:hypothetical protein